MYKKKSSSYAVIAIIYWLIQLAAFFVMGILFGKTPYYNIPYYLLIVLAVAIVLWKDKTIYALGFQKKQNKWNIIICITIIGASFLGSVLFSSHSFLKLGKSAIHYLFYVALVEEIEYRGLLQNYLFGLKCNKYLIFVIGALFFSLIHIPFQMYVNGDVSLHYLGVAFPQLVFTFLFHLLMCFVVQKRNDVLVPVALHFAIDYLQAVFC